MDWLRKLIGTKSNSKIERVVPVATIQLPELSNDDLEPVHGDQVLRREWAQDVLRQQGVPVNVNLPLIESEATARIRTTEEIAGRLLALAMVAVKGEGLEQELIDDIVTSRNIAPFFSPNETAFINDPTPSNHDRIQFAWQYECAWVMLWALKYVDGPLPYPDSICDVPFLAQTVRDNENLAQFGSQPPNNILNEADLIYRYHWAVRQASIDGVPAPAGLESGVVMERHRALNWLISYCDADWDEVGTDT
jgi:Domain of unknown function (DUF4272)